MVDPPDLPAVPNVALTPPHLGEAAQPNYLDDGSRLEVANPGADPVAPSQDWFSHLDEDVDLFAAQHPDDPMQHILTPLSPSDHPGTSTERGTELPDVGSGFSPTPPGHSAPPLGAGSDAQNMTGGAVAFPLGGPINHFDLELGPSQISEGSPNMTTQQPIPIPFTHQPTASSGDSSDNRSYDEPSDDAQPDYGEYA